MASGKLPEVSYIVPSAADSEHPGSSSPVESATIVYKVLDALGRNPDVWRHTALFLTYDENDGFFDHVPPPVPPAGTEGEFWEGRPVGLGIRVPMIVISPWTVGGYACSQVFDHTSIVRFLERWTGIEEPNISAWRRTVCGDLTAAFDFSRGRRQPSVRQPGAIPEFSGRWAPRPPVRQALPQQERGSRLLPGRCRTSRTPTAGSTRAPRSSGWPSATPVRHPSTWRSLRTRRNSRRHSTGTYGGRGVGCAGKGRYVPLHGDRAERLPAGIHAAPGRVPPRPPWSARGSTPNGRNSI